MIDDTHHNIIWNYSIPSQKDIDDVFDLDKPSNQICTLHLTTAV